MVDDEKFIETYQLQPEKVGQFDYYIGGDPLIRIEEVLEEILNEKKSK